MRGTGTTGRMLNTVFVLLLFCVFALTVLMTLLMGAGAYQGLQENMDRQYTERTGLMYLDAKLRHYDEAGAVQLEPFEDTTALALYEQVDGTRYKTLIYHHEGYIKELFFEDGLQFRPEDGQYVLAARQLTFQWKQPNLLHLVCVSEDGAEAELMVYLHSGEEVALYE